MRIVFIGDVVGRSGREALEKHLPEIKKETECDVTIVNGENAAHGIGITEKICKEFYEWGADVITGGNHIFDQREILSYIKRDERLVRPLNYPPNTPGKGVFSHQLPDGRIITVMQAMGRLFMDALDDPFSRTEEEIKKIKSSPAGKFIFVDFHAEATSEKQAFAHYLDGKVTAVIGTHTHVPTADCQILENGTAYQTDTGMTGDYNSVIGVKKHMSVRRFVEKTPGERFVPAEGEATLCGVFIEADDQTGLAKAITPIRKGPGF